MPRPIKSMLYGAVAALCLIGMTVEGAGEAKEAEKEQKALLTELTNRIWSNSDIPYIRTKKELSFTLNRVIVSVEAHKILADKTRGSLNRIISQSDENLQISERVINARGCFVLGKKTAYRYDDANSQIFIQIDSGSGAALTRKHITFRPQAQSFQFSTPKGTELVTRESDPQKFAEIKEEVDRQLAVEFEQREEEMRQMAAGTPPPLRQSRRRADYDHVSLITIDGEEYYQGEKSIEDYLFNKDYSESMLVTAKQFDFYRRKDGLLFKELICDLDGKPLKQIEYSDYQLLVPDDFFNNYCDSYTIVEVTDDAHGRDTLSTLPPAERRAAVIAPAIAPELKTKFKILPKAIAETTVGGAPSAMSTTLWWLGGGLGGLLLATGAVWLVAKRRNS